MVDSVSKVLPGLATISVTSIVLLMTLGWRPLSEVLSKDGPTNAPRPRPPITAALPLTILPFVFVSAMMSTVLCAVASAEHDCRRGLVEATAAILALAVTIVAALLALMWIVLHHSHRFAGPLKALRAAVGVAICCIAAGTEILLGITARVFSSATPAPLLGGIVVTTPALAAAAWQLRAWLRLRAGKSAPAITPTWITSGVFALFVFLGACVADVFSVTTGEIAANSVGSVGALWTIRIVTALVLGGIVLMLPQSRWFPDEREVRLEHYTPIAESPSADPGVTSPRAVGGGDV